MSGGTADSVGWTDVAAAAGEAAAVVADGRLVGVTDSFARALGYESRDGLVGTRWRAILDPADEERVDRAIGGAVASGTALVDPVSAVCANGTTEDLPLRIRRLDDATVVWVVDGRGGRDGGPVADPDDGNRSGDPSDSVSIPLGLVADDGRLLACNEPTVELLGADHREAVVGRELTTFVHEDDRDALADRLDEVVEGQAWTGRTTYCLERIDGEERVVEVSATRVDHDGGPAARVALVDVTRYERTRERMDEERLARQRELERYETIVGTVTDGIYVLDEELRYTLVNEALCEFYGRPREELLGSRVTAGMIFDDELQLAESMREQVVRGDRSTGVVEASGTTPDGDPIHAEARYRLHPEPDGEYRGSVGVIRDVTDRVERERRLERQRDELETLDRINRLLLEITRDLVETYSRQAVERTVCGSLAESARYRYAWVGGRDASGEVVGARATAGALDATGESNHTSPVEEGDHRSLPGLGVAKRALRTAEVQVQTADGATGEAFGDGPEVVRVAAIPLRHDETVYGVLTVGATDREAFADHERTGFEILGETVGFVLDAIKRRNLLVADQVVELELRLARTDTVLQRLSSRLEGTLSLEGYVASGEGWFLFLIADGVTPEVVEESAREEPAVDRVRILGEGADRRVELAVDSASVLDTLTRLGATVRGAVAEDGVTRYVVEAPITADVRELVELLHAELPAAELRSVRERDRSPAEGRIPEGILDDLTDRQREAMEAAFLTGYFEWPRDSTAEDVATVLDVAAPTLHAHLRKAQRTILSALFDADG